MIHLRVWTSSAVRQGEQAKVEASLVKAAINVRQLCKEAHEAT